MAAPTAAFRGINHMKKMKILGTAAVLALFAAAGADAICWWLDQTATDRESILRYAVQP